MRYLLLLALLPAAAGAAGLEIVKPIISQSDGGAPDPPGFDHAPGETLFFSCRIAGWSKTPEEKIHLAYSVQAFDPKGVALTELYKNELTDEVSPQDKEWLPKIATEVPIPPLVAGGEYKILVKTEDLIGKTNAELSVPFRVRGHELQPSDTLVVRNFHFYRSDDDTQPLERAVYKPGDGVWARFDLTGYKYGDHNKIDVSYVTSVIAPSGKLLWKQPEAATEQTESFYPKRYVQASMGINLTPTIKPGEYTILVEAKDAVGGQTHESKYTFTVE
ncbi:MAG TPA: hypothetical protein VGF59_22280 [Bryobacteraceae bacterium]